MSRTRDCYRFPRDNHSIHNTWLQRAAVKGTSKGTTALCGYLDGPVDVPLLGLGPLADAAQEVDHQLALDGVVDHHCRVRNIQQHKPHDCDGHKHPAQDVVSAASTSETGKG